LASTSAVERGRAVAFIVMWLVQGVSLVGSVLVEFSLGVYVFQRTGSATLFALIEAFIILPMIVFMPFAGAIADRYSRRLVMIVANLAGAVTIAAFAVLVAAGALQVWMVYLVTLLVSMCNVLLTPAYAASTPALVPERWLSRANAFTGFVGNVATLAGPPLAAVLLAVIGLNGIVLIDLATFLAAAAVLVPLTIPQPAVRPGQAARRRNLLREATDGLAYIIPRRGLLSLLLFFAVLNVTATFVTALFTPIALSFATVEQLSVTVAVFSSGLIVGSILMMVWSGPKRRVDGVLLSCMALGLGVVVIGSRASLPAMAIGGMVVNVAATVANVCNATIWYTRVPQEILGRVVGSLRTVAYLAIPFAVLVAGPLADRVFEPLMRPGGALAGSAGQVLGVGPGRGMGLLLVLAGLLAIANGAAGFLNRPLRRLDDEQAEQATAEPAPSPA
jgi:MFS family permease